MTDDYEIDDSIAQQRLHLHRAIADIPKIDRDIPDNAYLIGWVLMAEFMDSNGARWFVSRRGTDGGESDLMPWEEKGYLVHLLDEWRAATVRREFRNDLGEE